MGGSQEAGQKWGGGGGGALGEGLGRFRVFSRRFIGGNKNPPAVLGGGVTAPPPKRGFSPFLYIFTGLSGGWGGGPAGGSLRPRAGPQINGGVTLGKGGKFAPPNINMGGQPHSRLFLLKNRGGKMVGVGGGEGGHPHMMGGAQGGTPTPPCSSTRKIFISFILSLLCLSFPKFGAV